MTVEEYNINFCMLEPYNDDDGVAVDIFLHTFSDHKVPIVYLESEKCDDKMKNDIEFIILHQDELHNLIDKEIALYTKEVYKKEPYNFTLIKIYIFPDSQKEYGFLFGWLGDIEHGVGLRTQNLLVKKIGSAEASFL